MTETQGKRAVGVCVWEAKYSHSYASPQLQAIPGCRQGYLYTLFLHYKYCPYCGGRIKLEVVA